MFPRFRDLGQWMRDAYYYMLPSTSRMRNTIRRYLFRDSDRKNRVETVMRDCHRCSAFRTSSSGLSIRGIIRRTITTASRRPQVQQSTIRYEYSPGDLRFLILLKRWIVGQDGPKRNSSRRNPAYSSFCNNFETCQIHPMPTLKLLSSSGLEFSSTSKWLPKLRRSHCATWGAGCISGNLDL